MAERERRSLVGRDPFFGDLFETVPEFPRVYSRDFLDAFWGRGAAVREFPPLDVIEDGQRYFVTAELPGMRREDISVELHEGALTIRGEKRSERDYESERRRLTERSFGAFSRTVSLPSDADSDHVEAELTDGVLTVTVRKRAERRPRAIEVRVP